MDFEITQKNRGHLEVEVYVQRVKHSSADVNLPVNRKAKGNRILEALIIQTSLNNARLEFNWMENIFVSLSLQPFFRSDQSMLMGAKDSFPIAEDVSQLSGFELG